MHQTTIPITKNLKVDLLGYIQNKKSLFRQTNMEFLLYICVVTNASSADIYAMSTLGFMSTKSCSPRGLGIRF